MILKGDRIERIDAEIILAVYYLDRFVIIEIEASKGATNFVQPIYESSKRLQSL